MDPPPMIPFPLAEWTSHLLPEEWEACLEAWIILAQMHLLFSSSEFLRISSKDSSLPVFLSSFAQEIASSHDTQQPLSLYRLRKQSFLLAHRLLKLDVPPDVLLKWEFLADVSKIYGKSSGSKVLSIVWMKHASKMEASITYIKNLLVKELDAGLKSDLKTTETQLRRLNYLFNASPEAAAFFIAGSDMVDALIGCYKLMNPPLRKVLISTIYLCLIGLTEGKKPNFSSLVDQLYSLKTAAESHKLGPTNMNDSLVAELVTVTPILKQVQHRIKSNETGSSRAKSVIGALEKFRKSGGDKRPVRLIKRKVDKGKGLATGIEYGHESNGQMHIHRLSLVSQIQDLFPELGSGFVVKLLDEYGDNVEEVVAHLLEGSLPSQFNSADQSESLTTSQMPASELYSTSDIPIRRNIFDDDDFDQLAVDGSRLHFGRHNKERTADDILEDRSNAPNKAAILSALAAFDSDDDERDDTYDIADVGGTVDSATPGNSIEEPNTDIHDAIEEVLFRSYKTTPKLFGRDAMTRRSKERTTLREQTGMTDEALEGWSLMLSRDARQSRRLEAKYSAFSGGQVHLASTAWRASPAGSGTEEPDVDINNRGRGGRLLAGRGRGGRGRGRGNVAGSTGDKDTEAARRRKEANKGSSANHNRKAQNAKKMAQGGFSG